MASDNSLPFEDKPLNMSGPPLPVALTRSLSHAERAIDNTEHLLSTLVVGDSVLINWWHDNDVVDYTLLFKTERGIYTTDYHCSVAQFHRHWTHAAVSLPSHLNKLVESSIVDRWKS